MLSLIISKEDPMKQVEINGVVLEFDEKLLVKQEIRVGDSIQLLSEEYSAPKLYKGVVIQILPFQPEVPAVEVMYIDEGYNSFEIKRKIITPGADSKDKLIKSDGTFLPFTKDRAIDMLDKVIASKQHEYQEALDKKEYFLKYYNKYFTEIE